MLEDGPFYELELGPGREDDYGMGLIDTQFRITINEDTYRRILLILLEAAPEPEVELEYLTEFIRAKPVGFGLDPNPR
jgi:hypothetical protein